MTMHADPSGYAISGPDGQALRLDHGYDPLRDPTNCAPASHLASEGYAIVRGLVSQQRCMDLVAAFRAEVKPSRAPFYRHATDHPEPHVITSDGLMKHPVLNPHELWSARYRQTRMATLRILTDLRIQHFLEALFGEPGKLIHTMYFEGNQTTWAHQDSYYVDSTKIGAMVGLWIALEDIHPGAGRFYVYPRSHLLDMPRLGEGLVADPNGRAYKEWVLERIAASGLTCHAPALGRGDAIAFSSRTIHGSLPNPERGRSRNALAAHFIPDSHGIMWFHRDVRPEHTIQLDGMTVHFNRDLDVPRNRLILRAEAIRHAALERARALKARLLS